MSGDRPGMCLKRMIKDSFPFTQALDSSFSYRFDDPFPDGYPPLSKLHFYGGRRHPSKVKWIRIWNIVPTGTGWKHQESSQWTAKMREEAEIGSLLYSIGLSDWLTSGDLVVIMMSIHTKKWRCWASADMWLEGGRQEDGDRCLEKFSTYITASVIVRN